MPRRSIECDNCGFLVLKRDATCERCGADTPHVKRRMQGQLIRFVLMAIIVAGGWLYIKHEILAMAH